MTETFRQLTNTSDCTSQTHVQLMWAVGQGQTKGKFYICCIHYTAKQMGQALKLVSNMAHLLNPSQISELTWTATAMCPYTTWLLQKMEYCEEVLLEPHLQLQNEYTAFSSAQAPLSPDSASTSAD